jgi:hypothetical protein
MTETPLTTAFSINISQLIDSQHYVLQEKHLNSPVIQIHIFLIKDRTTTTQDGTMLHALQQSETSFVELYSYRQVD